MFGAKMAQTKIKTPKHLDLELGPNGGADELIRRNTP